MGTSPEGGGVSLGTRVPGSSASPASQASPSPTRLYTSKYASEDAYDPGVSVSPSFGTRGADAFLFLPFAFSPFPFLQPRSVPFVSIAGTCPDTEVSTATGTPNGPPRNAVTCSSSKRHHQSSPSDSFFFVFFRARRLPRKRRARFRP